MRKIYDIVIYQDNYGEVVIEIEGNGFLQNMVRIIAGTLLEVGTGSRDINSVQEILKNGSREDAGVMVPSQGLKLLKVKY